MKWQDQFKIEEHYFEDGDIGSCWRYHLIDIPTGKTVGKYKNEAYAIKQAKYKFKKTMAKVEKILLG